MAKLRVDYDNARANAKKLKSAGERCASVAKAVDKSKNGVGQYWNGGAADAFTGVLTGWCKTTKALEQELESLANTITLVANQLEAKEKELAAQVLANSAPSSTAASQLVKNIFNSATEGVK